MFPAIFRRLFANEGKGPKLRTDIIPDTLPGKTAQADMADKWSTARTVALSGAVTGSASVDGSKDATIMTTLANSGVIAGTYGQSTDVSPAGGTSFGVPMLQVNAKGIVTSAKTSMVTLPTTIRTADKLATGHTIDGASFDGSKDITHYGTCSTAAGTAAKTVALSDFVLGTGARVQVKFTNANTHTKATLNVNNTGAKAIYDQNGQITAEAIQANGLYEFVYDGTVWRMLNGGGSTYAEGISEAFRKSWIGVPRWWRSTVLPPNHCWANGDFVEFADWPELQEVYEDGGFEGMLMAYNADAETQAANLGKWRPDAANPTGLYTPNLSEQFLRASCQTRSFGTTNEAGLPGWDGEVSRSSYEQPPLSGGPFSEISGRGTAYGREAVHSCTIGVTFHMSAINEIYTNSDTVMPASINLPSIIYLGK